MKTSGSPHSSGLLSLTILKYRVRVEAVAGRTRLRTTRHVGQFQQPNRVVNELRNRILTPRRKSANPGSPEARSSSLRSARTSVSASDLSIESVSGRPQSAHSQPTVDPRCGETTREVQVGHSALSASALLTASARSTTSRPFLRPVARPTGPPPSWAGGCR